MKYLLLTLVLILPAAAQADSFQTEWDTYCNKVKSCALDQMGQTEMPEGMREMMMGTMNKMCASVKKSFDAAANSEHQEIIEAGARCLRSLHQKSCAQLMGGDAGMHQTPECQKYRELAESYQ